MTANGPLGVITMGSRRPNHFGQADLDLLSQISNQIALAVDNALAYGRLNASAARLEEERLYLESEIEAEYNFEDIVGKSAAIRKVLDQVAIVAPTSSTVLLHGETGTGKELVARAIHNLSPRRGRTFVRLNCAAIPSGWWKANSLATKRVLSRARSCRSEAVLSWRITAVFFRRDRRYHHGFAAEAPACPPGTGV